VCRAAKSGRRHVGAVRQRPDDGERARSCSCRRLSPAAQRSAGRVAAALRDHALRLAIGLTGACPRPTPSSVAAKRAAARLAPAACGRDLPHLHAPVSLVVPQCTRDELADDVSRAPVDGRGSPGRNATPDSRKTGRSAGSPRAIAADHLLPIIPGSPQAVLQMSTASNGRFVHKSEYVSRTIAPGDGQILFEPRHRPFMRRLNTLPRSAVGALEYQ